MVLEDMNMDLGPEEPEEGVPPPEDSGNRTFFIVAGIIGGIMLLALICLALYALVLAPRQRSQQAAQVATANAQNTQVAMAAEQTAQAGKWTATPTVTPVMPTATTTSTPVIVTPTQGGAPTVDRTATVAALLTEAAAGKLTASPTASGLPDTGFGEDVGLPMLVGLAFVLIVIIFLARRLRATS